MPWAKVKLSKGPPMVAPAQFRTFAQDDSLSWMGGGHHTNFDDDEEAAAARSEAVWQISEAREQQGSVAATSQVMVGTDLCYEAPLQLRAFALAPGIPGPCGNASNRFWKAPTGSIVSKRTNAPAGSGSGGASGGTSSGAPSAVSSFANPAGQMIGKKISLAKKDTHISVGHCRTKLESSRFLALIEDMLNALSSSTVQMLMDTLCDTPIPGKPQYRPKELPFFVSVHAVPVSPGFHCTAQVAAKAKTKHSEGGGKTSLPKEVSSFPHSTPTNSLWIALSKLLNATLKKLGLGEPDDGDVEEAKKNKEPALERLDALSFVALYTQRGVACCNHQFLNGLNHRDRMVLSMLVLGTQGSVGDDQTGTAFLKEVQMISGRTGEVTTVVLLHLSPTATLAFGVPKSLKASASAIGFSLVSLMQSKMSSHKGSGLAQGLLEEDAAGNAAAKKSSGGFCSSKPSDVADSGSSDDLPNCRVLAARVDALARYEQSCVTNLNDQSGGGQVAFSCCVECEDPKEKKPTRFLVTASDSAISGAGNERLAVTLQSQLIIAKQQLSTLAATAPLCVCGTGPGQATCHIRSEPIFSDGKKAPKRDKDGDPDESALYVLYVAVTHRAAASTKEVEEACGQFGSQAEYAGEYNSGKDSTSRDKARSLHSVLASLCHGCGILE